MNTNRLLHASYIALLTLSLSSTLANASEELFVTDDDIAIANIGKNHGSLTHMEILSNVIVDDDNESIANIGKNYGSLTHTEILTNVLPDDDDESIASIGVELDNASHVHATTSSTAPAKI